MLSLDFGAFVHPGATIRIDLKLHFILLIRSSYWRLQLITTVLVLKYALPVVLIVFPVKIVSVIPICLTTIIFNFYLLNAIFVFINILDFYACVINILGLVSLRSFCINFYENWREIVRVEIVKPCL